LMFARRPAPVQVSFAGYPETAGVEAIEYRISDRWLEAEENPGRERSPSVPHLRCASRDATERSASVPYPDGKERVFLVDSFWCYDPCGVDLLPNALPAQANGWLTFGSLNNFCKINEPVLRLWARVLGAVKASRLILLSARGSHRQRVIDLLAQAGVKAERVDFVEPCPRLAYLELYHQLDIVLDAFPYNGHTTSLDALWMGVPVVSLAGDRPVSRAGLSQLSNLGLQEFVARSETEYVEIATGLAHDLPRLAELRRVLRARMEASVLMDAERFTRGIEAAYRTMWRQWCGNDE
jgi:protein O-GlcNAc transferase